MPMIIVLLFPLLSRAAALEDHELGINSWKIKKFETSKDVEYPLRKRDGESFYDEPCKKMNDDDFQEQYDEKLGLARAACTRRALKASSSNLDGIEACARAEALEALRLDPVCGSAKAPITWVSAYYKLSTSKKCLMELFLYAKSKNQFPDRMTLGRGIDFEVTDTVDIESHRTVIPLKISRKKDGQEKVLGDAKLVCLPNTDMEDINRAIKEDFGFSKTLDLTPKPQKKSSAATPSRGTASEISLEVPWKKKDRQQ